MKKRISVGLAILIFSSFLMSGQARANEEDMKVILTDGLYGGIVGFIIGGAVLLFNPDTDNIDYLGYGAGAGIIAGTAYGIFTTVSPSFMEYKDSSLSFSLPSLRVRIKRKKHSQKSDLTVLSEVFRYRF